MNWKGKLNYKCVCLWLMNVLFFLFLCLSIHSFSQMSHVRLDLPYHQSNNKNTISAQGAKLAQIELVIRELKKFFKEHPAEYTAVKGKLSDDVKEVTKVEMRNDLSKKQLFSILLISLLEEALESSTLAILKSRDSLFKTVSRSSPFEYAA